MRKFIITTGIVLVIVILSALVFDWGRKQVVAPATNGNATTTESSMIILSPKANQEVRSPIEIKGKAKGNWFFEAVFPVKLKDESGNIIASGQARADGDWMSPDFVDFSAEITYDNSTTTGRAVLVFKNDNPSGDPKFDKFFYVPVILK